MAAKFFEPKLNAGRSKEDNLKTEVKYERYTVYSSQKNDPIKNNECKESKTNNIATLNIKGSALGPYWLSKLKHNKVLNNKV